MYGYVTKRWLYSSQLESESVKVILNNLAIGEILLESKIFRVSCPSLPVSQMAPIANRCMITGLTQQLFTNIYYVHDIILGTREIVNRQKSLN